MKVISTLSQIGFFPFAVLKQSLSPLSDKKHIGGRKDKYIKTAAASFIEAAAFVYSVFSLYPSDSIKAISSSVRSAKLPFST